MQSLQDLNYIPFLLPSSRFVEDQQINSYVQQLMMIHSFKTNGVHKMSPNQNNDAMNNVPFWFLAFSIENRYVEFNFC